MSFQDNIARGFDAFGREAYKEASDYARAALAEAPNDPGAQTLLGRLALRSARPDVALGIFEKLTVGPAPAAVWLDLARALLDLRREEEALEAAGTAAAGAPTFAEAWFLIGEIATMLDDLPLAEEGYRKALEFEPRNTEAMVRLFRIAPASARDEAGMRALLASPGSPAEDQANVHYALANVAKRNGQRKAFIDHLLAANAAQRKAYTGAMPDLKATNERLMKIFSADAFRRAQSAEVLLPTPIFIVGMPRSGTTLVEQIVTGAPGVASAGELKFYRDVLPSEMEAMTGRTFPEAFDSLSRQQMTRLAEPLAHLHFNIARDASYVTDKTLDNFQRIGLLAKMFPAGKIICLRRDPMDVCFSMLQQQFSTKIPQTFDIELMAQACRRFDDIMNHWRRTCADRFIEVQYEQLVADPRTHAQAIVAYCGLRWDDALLNFHDRAGAVRTFSDQQVRKPISDTSVGAWREFADELEPLRRALAANGVKFAA